MGELEKRIREQAKLGKGFGANHSLEMASRNLSDYATIAVKDIREVLEKAKKEAPNYVERSPWFKKWFGE